MPKLISLNIERSKHLHRNIPFLQKEQPDVLCLQEVLEADLSKIAEDLLMPYHIWLKDILTNASTNSNGKAGYSGPAIFSRTPMFETGNEYYHFPEGGIVLEGEADRYSETNAQGIVWMSTDIGGERYVFANTHFTWSRNGNTSEKQLLDFENLKKILATLPPHVLCGDFNAPRGRGVWEKFIEFYGLDNVPQSITTTIDPELHRVKGLELVVDGIFAKPPYSVKDVRVVSGLSDHQAIVARIEKNSF